MSDDGIHDELDVFEFFGEPIFVYTRAQAIEDGTLVDGGDEVQALAREAGFVWPIAFTAEAWAEVIAWDDTNAAYQDVTGRLWDVFMVLRHAIKMSTVSDGPMPFTVLRVPNRPTGHRATHAPLVAHAGPGDNFEPVLTVMLPSES